MYTIGIDIGGTNLAGGLLDKFRIVAREDIPVETTDTAENLYQKTVGLIDRLMEKGGISKEQVDSIGIGIPGIVDQETDTIRFCNNIPLDGFPLNRRLREHYRKPVKMENDADCAALGEALAGADKGTDCMLMLTLGTGIGGALITDGRIASGHRGLGGELGHMGIAMNGRRCSCGRKGCIEMYASATGLLLTAAAEKRRASRHEDTTYLNSPSRIFEEAARKNTTAQRVVGRYIEHLTYGILNYINLYAPSIIILGGGISNQGKSLADAVLREVKKKIYSRRLLPAIVCAELKNDAGIIGAASLGSVSGKWKLEE